MATCAGALACLGIGCSSSTPGTGTGTATGASTGSVTGGGGQGTAGGSMVAGDGGQGNVAGGSSSPDASMGGSGTGTVDGGTGTGTSTGASFKECADNATDAELVPANLLFVVDRSGSMNCTPDTPSAECELDPRYDPTVESKWDITATALWSALESLAEKPNVSVGVNMFPDAGSGGQDACNVEQELSVDVGTLDEGHLDDLRTFFSGVIPSGATPLVGATTLGYAAILDRLVEGTLEGNTFVVLITDGKETCDTVEGSGGDTPLDTLLTQTIADSRQLSIRTFVIGSPGSEDFRGPLSQIAFEGGTALSADCDHSGDDDTGNCHFDMTRATDFEAELSAALDAITNDRSLSCIFDIPNERVNLGLVNVSHELDGDETVLVRDDRDCATDADGWQYIQDPATGEVKIELCGDACDAVASMGGQVRIVLGCPSRVIQ